MGKSINRSVRIRVAAAFVAVLLFSVMITVNIIRMDRAQKASRQANELLERCHKAETAHYKWAANLSSALYAGTDFTGSTAYDSCVLGQWIYGDAGTQDERILSLRSEMEPLHKELHQSASYVLELKATSPVQARLYYQNTIQATLTTLVGKLDQVVGLLSVSNTQSVEGMESIITIMHASTAVGLCVAIIALISLVIYVMSCVVKPILVITEDCKPLQEGRLRLEIPYSSKNELNTLARTLEQSMERVSGYVDDINHIMAQFSKGNFNVTTATEYIGDFRSIEESIDGFTATISEAFVNINEAERQVTGHAEHLSSGAQNLAQGATEQASAVQQLFATLEEMRKSSDANVAAATDAKSSAVMTAHQVNDCSKQMEQMVVAMEDITRASQEIGRIIATIENIAFQTNILALNAAVEAARAGSAGKGFAVVADEVRSLAGQSDEAAKATKELIGNSVQVTARGREIVGEVSQTLQAALELVTQSTTGIAGIVKAVEGEAGSIAQVTDAIGQISAVVQSNSASSEESAAVSAELFQQVRILGEQTGRFKLKGDGRTGGNTPRLPFGQF
ncbi:MAG: CZB domain-containing protein [Oscillospiraceae bacterium]|nr:CZB domain-containing protein [Oscillospiraceae bacterium]